MRWKRHILTGLFLFFHFNAPVLAGNDNRIIGIVELPGIFGAPIPNGPPGLIPPEKCEPLPGYSRPNKNSLVMIIDNPEKVVSEEYAYGESGALVFEKLKKWYRIRVKFAGKETPVWISSKHTGKYYGLGDLLKTSLAYLKTNWDGVLFSKPNFSGEKKKLEVMKEHVPINVLDVKELKKSIWIKIEVFEKSPCDGSRPMKVIAKGWVPAHRSDGAIQIWFYSRGC